MLNPCETRAAAGELSNGVQAAALPVPTTYIGRDEERRLREPSPRVCVLIVEGCTLPVAAHADIHVHIHINILTSQPAALSARIAAVKGVG